MVIFLAMYTYLIFNTYFYRDTYFIYTGVSIRKKTQRYQLLMQPHLTDLLFKFQKLFCIDYVLIKMERIIYCPQLIFTYFDKGAFAIS